MSINITTHPIQLLAMAVPIQFIRTTKYTHIHTPAKHILCSVLNVCLSSSWMFKFYTENVWNNNKTNHFLFLNWCFVFSLYLNEIKNFCSISSTSIRHLVKISGAMSEREKKTGRQQIDFNDMNFEWSYLVSTQSIIISLFHCLILYAVPCDHSASTPRISHFSKRVW